ncbi:MULTISPECIES: uracil phosphoribosyltransferase [unclassified Deinococcus]|uniref:uracil phosphoribosyltransferase n=1 Tax=unclassified Deinococcus TaxID=2623546 RepID=UPI000C189095|nr:MULTISPECIES: uracil phosphoribosyltransferase [unclassified Deinococcus]MCD0158163.1 uracil phosphoribosyltransferase [Deinococcus sp. 6GRE01]MCD0162103.1 uracil phosphoribosyltransferase [Deinococcus sp. 6YEL10]MCD0169987.1 uracil phosphoribosyltransferase [Deinococcus sp. 23YEL01]MCD0176784.1 uracil phosphoribosyltransferase [Deinococcus sp. 14RED07]PIG99578.1 uracil phosphoribosyltransferase [Deinococcus sp. UR1]
MVTVVTHPLVQHKLSVMRDVHTGVKEFRELAGELSLLLAYEAMRDLETVQETVQTPITQAQFPMLSGKKLALVAILRAGLIMTDAIVQLVPAAKVGHIGLYRDPESLLPVAYYNKLPTDIAERRVFLTDPMLATGGSAVAAIERLKEAGATSIKLMCILAAPEGIALIEREHPDVEMVVAAVDSHLNDHGYIVPGLGDAGDRIYGTK